MSNALAALDTLLRGAAIALLLASAGLGLAGAGLRRGALALALTSLGLAAYVAVSSPHLTLAPVPAGALEAFAAAVPVLFYWAAAELFLDDPDWRPWPIAVAAAILLLGWLAPLLPVLGTVRGWAVPVLYLHLLYLVVRSARGDLVERRRRFRMAFLIASTLAGVAIALVELTGADRALPHWVFAVQAALIATLSAAFLGWAAGLRADVWPAPAAPSSERPFSQLSPAEAAVLSRLEAAMAAEAWREEGLTIGALAARLETPEHRLRRVINGALGHRNFAAYVNGHRVAAAKARLADPEAADTPVLTIAYEVGFASLGPFNRAFRAETGESPTEYRRKAVEARRI